MSKVALLVLLLMTSVAGAVDMDSKSFKSAVELYRFWYPTVSMEGIMNGMRTAGIKDGTHMFSLQADANSLGFTANQDTPYGAAVVDLTKGPYVVDLPAGPFMGLVNDHSQRWISDMGLPGPDAGKGGKHLIVPADYKGSIPSGYFVGRAETTKVLIVARIVPQNGESQNSAQEKLKQIKIYPLSSAKNPQVLSVVSINGKKGDMSLLKWESNIQFWQKLSKILNEEAINSKYQAMHDGLKEFGIQKGKDFKPNGETKELLEQAAREGKRQMLDVAFNATDKPERFKWNDRKWEWLILTGDARWAADHDMDVVARDRYFYQAIIMSPAMMKRDPTAGSLYWGAFQDAAGGVLDGGKTYKLTVPLPVPARLFWSVSLYDTDTRSLIANGTKKSALRSLMELSELKNEKSVDLYFGPKAPVGKNSAWIKTTLGKSWFAYFRIYGPDKGAFDNSWRPGDIVEIKASTLASSEE